MPDPRTVVASAARTATGNSGAISLTNVFTEARRGQRVERIALLANITAASGTSPSLTLSVEWSHDGTTFAAVDGTADAFAAMTAANVRVKEFTIKAPFYRVVWTISGTTPSFTFSVAELAV